jgi:GR25 family glycosyltransferase involved in LPS biosynthesis
VSEPVQQFAAHEWNATRFQVLGRIRNKSLQRALDFGCDFYFVSDVDNFVRPNTLRDLVALNLPIVAPLLRSLEPSRFYSNYHAEIDDSGYYRNSDQYMWILQQWVSGVIEVPVVHTTYLVRADVLPELSYLDGTSRYEYVIFSDSARKADVQQYIDNRQVYGYITFGEGSEQHVAGGVDLARRLLSSDPAFAADRAPAEPGVRGATEFVSESAATRRSILAADVSSSRSKDCATLPSVRSVPARELHELAEIHLINLDRSVDRLDMFKERNAHLENVLRVSAVDGMAIDRRALQENGTITDDLPYGGGTLGCALSHIQLWHKAVEFDRFVTVFEDDTISAANFAEESEKILSNLPEDWEFIQWGWNFDPLHLWVDLDFSKANLRFYDRRFAHDPIAFQQARLRREAVKLVHSFGAMSYSVSPTGARKLLEGCLPLRKQRIPFPDTGIVNHDTGIDVAMCAVYPSMQAFLCIPPLVVHDNITPSVRKTTDAA